MSSVVREAPCNFGSVDGATLSLRGKAEVAVSTAAATSQTDDVDMFEVQTENAEEGGVDPDAFNLAGWQPEQELADFILGKGPELESQLRSNVENPLPGLAEEAHVRGPGGVDPRVLHTLVLSESVQSAVAAGGDADRRPAARIEEDDELLGGGADSRPLLARCVAWNTSGSRVVVGYGRKDDAGWSTSRGAIAAWCPSTPSFLPSEPEFSATTSSSVLCLAGHPEHPALVAGGTFSGEVVVWNVVDASARPLTSPIGDYAHCEPVVGVGWVYDSALKDYLVASVGADGRFLLWSQDNELQTPVQGFSMTRGKIRRRADGANMVAGTCLGLSRVGKLQGFAVLGSHGGSLSRCLLRGPQGAAPSAARVELLPDAARVLHRVPPRHRNDVVTAVVDYATREHRRSVSAVDVFEARPPRLALFPSLPRGSFQPHAGPVLAATYCPFLMHLFLTASADGEVRLYHQLHTDPLLRFEPAADASPVRAVAWSHARPAMFAAASADGTLYVFDLAESTVGPVHALRAEGSGRGAAAPLTALAFNPSRIGRTLVTACGEDGAARVWQVPVDGSGGSADADLAILKSLAADQEAVA